MKPQLPTALAFALFVLPALGAAQTAATPPPTATERATLTGNVAGRAEGRTAVNQAAGSGNTQANLAAIAFSSEGLAALQLGSQQSATFTDARRDASAHIDGAAFNASRGLLSINQAAGVGNAQANLIGIGQGQFATAGLALGQTIIGLEDAALAQVSGDAPASSDASAPEPLREAVIGGAALRSSQGIVQVNQTAGAGNRSANAIVLLLPGGTP